jgi:glycosyltransferase involved in cell wall biosynthesis
MIGKIWSTLRWWTYPGASRIVVQTEGARKYFLPRFQDKVVVIPNPVVLPTPGPAPSVRQTGHRVILAIGRLSEEKGFDDLLQAFERIKDLHPDWIVTIIGDGPQRQVLETLCVKSGIARQVRLLGFVKNPWESFRHADLFVLPSRFEGFPNALCEAMACGLPVIATDCQSGPGEIIRDGVNGVLVPPGDVPALSVAMDRLMSDPVKRTRLGRSAQAIAQQFGLEKVMRMWEDVLQPSV